MDTYWFLLFLFFNRFCFFLNFFFRFWFLWDYFWDSFTIHTEIRNLLESLAEFHLCISKSLFKVVTLVLPFLNLLLQFFNFFLKYEKKVF